MGARLPNARYRRAASAMRNRFFLWPRDLDGPRELVPSANAGEFRLPDQLEPLRETGLRYFFRLAGELDAALPEAGVTFLLTWHLDAFDERFREAIVVLAGDEKHQVPSYVGKVRSIFKTGGIRRNPAGEILDLQPSIAWRVAVRDLRDHLFAARRRLRHRFHGSAPTFEIPLGYFLLTEVPFVPIPKRPTDVF